MPNFTLVLTAETAERIKELNRIFGGSVGGFATAFVNDLAELEPQQVLNVRQQIAALADERRSAGQSRKQVFGSASGANPLR